MADFKVKLDVDIDTSEIQSKLDGLKINKITVGNDIVSDIENKLNNASITLNNVKLGGDVVGNIQKQLSGQKIKTPKIDIDVGANNVSKKISAELARQYKELYRNNKTIFSNVDEKTYSAKINTLETKLKSYFANGSKEYTNTANSLNQVTKAYEKLNIAKNRYQADPTKSNYTAMVTVNEKLVSSMKKTENEIKILSNVQDKVLKGSTKASMEKGFESYWQNNTKALKAYRTEYENLQAELASITTTGEAEAFKKSFNDLQTRAIKEGNVGKTWAEEIKRGFGAIGQFAATYGLQMYGVQVAQEAVQNVVEIDSAMTELKKVSDITDNQVSGFFENANAQAQKYGASLTDIISSTADWSRLGYNLKDSQTLADATTLLQTVGDNMTQESSSEGLIAILKGFSKQADEAESIIDVINQVSNTEPIDSAGIVEALQRSASSLDAAGNDLNQSVAMITAAKHYWLKDMETYFYRTYLIASIV